MWGQSVGRPASGQGAGVAPVGKPTQLLGLVGPGGGAAGPGEPPVNPLTVGLMHWYRADGTDSSGNDWIYTGYRRTPGTAAGVTGEADTAADCPIASDDRNNLACGRAGVFPSRRLHVAGCGQTPLTVGFGTYPLLAHGCGDQHEVNLGVTNQVAGDLTVELACMTLGWTALNVWTTRRGAWLSRWQHCRICTVRGGITIGFWVNGVARGDGGCPSAVVRDDRRSLRLMGDVPGFGRRQDVQFWGVWNRVLTAPED